MLNENAHSHVDCQNMIICCAIFYVNVGKYFLIYTKIAIKQLSMQTSGSVGAILAEPDERYCMNNCLTPKRYHLKQALKRK